MKEKFEEVKIELIYLENDVVTTSITGAAEDNDDGNGTGI